MKRRFEQLYPILIFILQYHLEILAENWTVLKTYISLKYMVMLKNTQTNKTPKPKTQ